MAASGTPPPLPLPLLLLLCSMIMFCTTHASASFSSSSLNLNSLCEETPYPELCKSSSIAVDSMPTISPEGLIGDVIGSVLKSSLSVVQRAFSSAQSLSGRAQSPLEQDALQDCTDLLDVTQDQLNGALTELLRLSPLLPRIPEDGDILTFLSAGITNQDTCLDSLAGTSGEVKAELQGPVTQISQLVANALSLIAKIGNSLGSEMQKMPENRIHNRRLLASRVRIHGFKHSKMLASVDPLGMSNGAPGDDPKRLGFHLSMGTSGIMLGKVSIEAPSDDPNRLGFQSSTDPSGILLHEMSIEPLGNDPKRLGFQSSTDLPRTLLGRMSIERPGDDPKRLGYQSFTGTSETLPGRMSIEPLGDDPNQLRFQSSTGTLGTLPGKMTTQAVDNDSKRLGFQSSTDLSRTLSRTQVGRMSIETIEAPSDDPKRLGHQSSMDKSRTMLDGMSIEVLNDDIFPVWRRERRLLQSDPDDLTGNANVVVAQDGSGDYTTIAEAIYDAPDNGQGRYVIYVKAGVYQEKLEIKKKKTNLMLVGDGMDATVITGNKHVFHTQTTTYRSATVAVTAAKFIARDICFENTAGPEGMQAVALRSGSDMSVFYRCAFKGYQDTLYVHSLRQFFRDCNIYGTVDFIFGNAAVVFQNCQILARKPLPNQIITITAQGRQNPNMNTGISIQNCNITADEDLAPVNETFPTYLGRPWKLYSRTVVMQSFIDNNVSPQGWAPWNSSDFALDTCFYGEYMNSGPASGLAGRVSWTGFHAITDSSEASQFTASKFIEGDAWLPSTGVNYNAGLNP